MNPHHHYEMHPELCQPPLPLVETPEPMTWILVGGGLILMAIWRRRR